MTHDRHRPPSRPRAPRPAWRTAWVAFVTLLFAASPAPAAAAQPLTPAAAALVGEARSCEDAGDPAGAAVALRKLRAMTPRDADLELWLALFEARAGMLDSARARLAGPVLRTAHADSAPAKRWTAYPYRKEWTWTDGRWTGWHWYLWRARTEVAAATGRWDEALAAARRASGARPESGRDWYARALCAARTGHRAEAESALARAWRFDPMLPEPHYLAGLLAWAAGRRNEAQERFRTAVAMDSTYRAPTLALLHVMRPGATPDSLPSELLSGVRRAALLTAADGPKREGFRKLEVTPAVMVKEDAPELSAGREPGAAPVRLTVAMLLDAEGRVALTDVPVLRPTGLDPARVAAVLATLSRWQYSPAVADGINIPSWTAWVFEFQP
jgi:predicted Zn-dependent protease